MKIKDLEPLDNLTKYIKDCKLDGPPAWFNQSDKMHPDEKSKKVSLRASLTVCMPHYNGLSEDPPIDGEIRVERILNDIDHKTKSTIEIKLNFGESLYPGKSESLVLVLVRDNDPYTFKGLTDFKVESISVKNKSADWIKGLNNFALTKVIQTQIKKSLAPLIIQLGEWQDLQSPVLMAELIKHQDELFDEVEQKRLDEEADRMNDRMDEWMRRGYVKNIVI